jgi:hypothetical protein
VLRLHSHYGPLDRSATRSGLCHEASVRPITRPDRSSATRSIDNYPGGISLHWQCTPSGRTIEFTIGTGITAYLEANGTLENAQAMAAHESPRPTRLYDRTDDEITLDEVERIAI